MKNIIASLMILSILLTSCCTVASKHTEIVSIQSTPPGADITIDGYACGVTPQSFEIDARRHHNVTLSKENYYTSQHQLSSKTSCAKLGRNAIFPVVGTASGGIVGLLASGGLAGMGIMAIFPPLIYGAAAGATAGLLGLGIDASTGAARQLETQTIDINLTPLK